MKRVFSKEEVLKGSIISFDDDPSVHYKVVSCIRLDFLGKKGYQLNVVRK